MTREQLARLQKEAPPAFVEAYQNARGAPGEADWIALRWWADPFDKRILIGGTIQSRDDWRHLKDRLGIGAVITAEVERDDVSVGVPAELICDVGVSDNGQPNIDLYVKAIKFARRHTSERLYVHCAMGGSRSPSLAYAILRDGGLSSTRIIQAYQHIFSAKLNGHPWGEHPFHMAYVGAAEAALVRLATGG